MVEKSKEGKETHAAGWQRRNSTGSIYGCIKN